MQERSMGRPEATGDPVVFKTSVVVALGVAIGVALGLLTAIFGVR